MKYRLGLCTALCVVASYGATITCATNLTLSVGGSSPTVTCGSVEFSNFDLYNSTGNSMGVLNISSITENTSTGVISLTENPNLGVNGHVDLSYSVTALNSGGDVSQIGLSVGGTGGAITEIACANPVATSGMLAGLCANSSGTVSATPLATLSVNSGTSNQPIFSNVSTSASSIYVFKDILTTGSGSSLGAVTESFQVPAAGTGPTSVPEPTSFVLLGSGLLALSLVRRWHKS